MDEFKKHLQQSAKEMDVDAPADAVWQRILTTKAAREKTPVRLLIFRMAAAACIVAIAFLGIKNFFTADTKIVTPAAIAKTADTNAQNNIDATPAIINATTDTTEQAPVAKASSIQIIKSSSKKNTQRNLSQPEQLLASFENNYAKLVALQLNTIRSTPVYNETEDYFDGLKTQFRQAEADESNIKNTIKKQGLTDELLEQMIAIYQQKINLLKTLQNQITLINKKVKENHTTTDSLKTSFINI